MKLLTIVVVALAPLGLVAEEFNFSQELNNTNNLSNTIDFIASYHSMAQKVSSEDSSRLAKKLVKLIVSLHTICSAEDQTIRKAYKSLLETALKNEKLVSVDHLTELQKLLTIYTDLELTPVVTEPIITDSLTTEPVTDPVTTTSPEVTTPAEPVVTEPEVDQPTEEQLRLEKLRKNTTLADRNAVTQRLILRRVINDVTKLAQEFNGLKKEVAQFSEQNSLVLLMYKKLLNIEQLVKYGNAGIRFPEETEYSTLMKTLSLEEGYPLSSTRIVEPSESFSTMK